MIVYTRRTNGADQYLLLFGSGLIGSAVDAALIKQSGWYARSLPWVWSNSEQRASQAKALGGKITRAKRVDIVWAAGVSGFGSSIAAMEQETGHVAEIAELAQALAGQNEQVVFHLFSSMGGLYEGQSWINKDSKPIAKRPYGQGKLAQEKLVRQLGNGIVPRIYRPSSVYGFARNGRRGLFAAMITAALRQEPLVFYGSPQTLRDYVLAQDIGTYLASTLTEPKATPAIAFLGSGKPTSLVEATSIIEMLLGRQIYCRYDSAPHNALDMTVRRSALPKSLPHTPITVGVASILQGIAGSLLCNPHQQK